MRGMCCFAHLDVAHKMEIFTGVRASEDVKHERSLDCAPRERENAAVEFVGLVLFVSPFYFLFFYFSCTHLRK